MTNKYTPNYMVLDNGRTVSKEIFDAVRINVDEILPALRPGPKYTTAQLCGDAYWSPLSTADKHSAGMCLFQMVKSRTIGLELATCLHQVPRKYRMK